VQNLVFKFQAVAEKTTKNVRGLLYFAAPCTYNFDATLAFLQTERRNCTAGMLNINVTCHPSSR